MNHALVINNKGAAVRSSQCADVTAVLAMVVAMTAMSPTVAVAVAVATDVTVAVAIDVAVTVPIDVAVAVAFCLITVHLLLTTVECKAVQWAP